MPVRSIGAAHVLTCLALSLGSGACAMQTKPAPVDPLVAEAAARGAIPAPRIRPLAAGVWLHESWKREADGSLQSVNGLLVGQGEQAALVDGTWSAGDERALYAQAQAQGLTIRAALLTQAHDERVVGLDALAKEHQMPTYGLARTQAEALLHRVRTPEHALGDAGALSLNGTEVQYFHATPGFSSDNLVVYLPAQHVLFAGGMVRALDARLSPRGEADLSPWRAAIEQIRARFPDATTVVPAEGKPGGRELLAHTMTLLDAKLADISGRFGGG